MFINFIFLLISVICATKKRYGLTILFFIIFFVCMLGSYFHHATDNLPLQF